MKGHEFIDHNLDIILVIDFVRRLAREKLDDVKSVYQSDILVSLAGEFMQHQGRDFDLGLNIFTLISDHYRKENFHSDIIALLLDPTANHQEGSVFLQHFLDYLRNSKNGRSINILNYGNAVVEREISRIDISIKDPISMRAIIIENKMNNAPDMVRQIPRYHTVLEGQGYTVDAVVYLVLFGNKQPNTHDWEEPERRFILPKMILIAAYEESQTDLYNGWLIKCESLAKNLDAFFLLKQYNQLIRTIGGRNMNRPLMESFMQQMLIEDNYQTANALSDMLQDLITYRRDKIIDHCRYTAAPYTKIGDWNNYAVLNDYWLGDSQFSIDIIVTRNHYQLQFFDRSLPRKDIPASSKNPGLWLLEIIGLDGEFHPAGLRYEKVFDFPSQESELYAFLDNILLKLRAFQAENISNPILD